MGRIFKTVPPPYRIGKHTADAYIPATDDQRKYMERKLAVCEYVNLPKNNRMETLAYIISDLKAENVELEQRVHQLEDDYNDVVRLLNGKETRKDEDPARLFLADMQKMRDHCDMLEKNIEQLKRQCVQLQIERNEAKTHAEQCDIIQKEMRDHCDKLEKENRELERFAKAIHSFVKDKKLYMAKGANCQYYQDGPHVCSSFCLECKSCLGVIEGLGVICAEKLVEASVSLPNDVGEVMSAEASSSLATDVGEERLAEASEVFPND